MVQDSAHKQHESISQDHHMVKHSISNLDEISRKIFLMNYTGYTFQAIALKLHISELTIQSKLQFIKKQLKNELAGINKV